MGLGGGADCALTVADSSDDPEDEEPEEHVGGVAQQQDEEQADHHGYHQSTAAAQTHHRVSGTKLGFTSSASGGSPATDQINAKIRRKARLHQNPVPGVSVILKDLHSNLIGVEQVGDASEGITREYSW